MKTHISLFFLLVILLLVSCEKEETPKPLPEAGYPTTYNVLSQSEWETVNAEFQKINNQAGLEINRYGFANGEVVWNDFDTITKEFVVATIDSLLASYGEYFGIPQENVFNLENDIVITNPNLIPEMQVSLNTFFQIAEEYRSDILKGVKYRFYINQNRIHEKYSVGISLCFYFDMETNKIQISGFWIPDALVPAASIYTEEEAYHIARKEIIHQLGEDLDEIEKGTESVNIYKALVKIYNNENIEIRDCWRIGKLDIVWGNYPISVFVDSQTGEIVSFSTK